MRSALPCSSQSARTNGKSTRLVGEPSVAHTTVANASVAVVPVIALCLTVAPLAPTRRPRSPFPCALRPGASQCPSLAQARCGPWRHDRIGRRGLRLAAPSRAASVAATLSPSASGA